MLKLYVLYSRDRSPKVLNMDMRDEENLQAVASMAEEHPHVNYFLVEVTETTDIFKEQT